jgi:hypothetical protein
MSSETYIIIGGAYNLGFVIFHVFFWKIFNWKKELRLLNIVNKGIVQVLNLCLTLVFLLFAYISIFHTTELMTTSLGKTILFFISIFWYLRALEQIYFFGLKNRISLILFMIFVLGGLIYSYPFIKSI